MEQLSGLDSVFLALDGDRVQGHAGGVGVFRPSAARGAITLEALKHDIASRLSRLPALTRRLYQVPLGLDHPYWVDDPDVDLSHHVREHTLEEMETLEDVLARLHSQRLVRERPLWEMHLVHGLPEGRQALYLKIHHAVVDGIAGNDLLRALWAVEPDRVLVEGRFGTGEAASSTLTGLIAGTLHTLARTPRRAAVVASAGLRATPALVGRVRRALPPHAEPIGRLTAPATTFNKSVGRQRKVSLCSVPFDDVASVKDRHGVTVNDVVLAMCAGALRQWLRDQDALPEAPLVVAVPISVRAPDDDGSGGNLIGAIFVPLPTHIGDIGARLRTIHTAMSSAKQRHATLPPSVMIDACALMSPTVASLGFKAVSRLRLLERISVFNLLVSTVPGPSGPLDCLGAALEHYYPLSQVTDGQGLNITTFTFEKHLNIGILGDPDLTPDLDALADYVVKELQAMHAHSGDHHD